jgi:hypothetical protein
MPSVGELWLTHQRHLNVVAVAKRRELSGVVFVRGPAPGRRLPHRGRPPSPSLPMRWFRADLHIHSTLSPCGSLRLSPRPIPNDPDLFGDQVVDENEEMSSAAFGGGGGAGGSPGGW